MSDFIPTTEQLEAITGFSYVKQAPETLVVLGMPDPDYRRTGKLTFSFLRGMEPTDAHGAEFFFKEQTRDMQIGSWIHQALLTPSIQLPPFAVQPKEIGGKPWRANRKECVAWTEENETKGIEILTAKEAAQLFGAIEAVSNNDEAMGLLTHCENEVSLFQRMNVNGVEFMRGCRIDNKPNGQKCLGDIKSVQRGDGSEDAFTRKIKWEFYGEQAAWYLDIWNACNPDDQKSQFVWIVVEKFHPFSVYLYYLNIDQLAPFRTRIMDRMERAAKAIGEGVFRGDKSIKQIIL